MIGARIDFTFTAMVKSPLHIGAGTEVNMSMIASDAKVQIAQTCVDFEGYPIIPGSSLKGILAHLIGSNLALFGGEDAPDQMLGGKVVFWNAEIQRKTVQKHGPYHDLSVPGRNKVHGDYSLYIETNTSIDPATGVVEAGRLFHKQMVAPGSCFSLQLSARADIEKSCLIHLLATLCNSHGINIGKGTKSGDGRIVVDPSSLQATEIRANGESMECSADWRDRLAKGQPAQTGNALGTLTIECDGPYLIADPSIPRKAGDTETAQITARKDHENKPLLSGSTLLGALRAEFAMWLDRRGEDGSDDKDAAFGETELSQTQRLFGITGMKGLVGIATITSTKETTQAPITSVKLDRFSAAPIDNALFATDAWVAPAFQIEMTFDHKRKSSNDAETFKEFLRELGDPIWGGLQLGLGKNKGYGWFKATFEGGEK